MTHFRRMGITLSAISLATSVSSAAITQCNPDLEFSWSYNQIEHSSEIGEIDDGLPIVTLSFDAGFLKILEADTNQIDLFRQIAIRKDAADSVGLAVRYEHTSSRTISKTSVIVSDPMCKNIGMSQVVIFETNEISYSTTVYQCECLSEVHDIDHFIFLE